MINSTGSETAQPFDVAGLRDWSIHGACREVTPEAKQRVLEVEIQSLRKEYRKENNHTGKIQKDIDNQLVSEAGEIVLQMQKSEPAYTKAVEAKEREVKDEFTGSKSQQRRAAEICGRCTVRRECFEYAKSQIEKEELVDRSKDRYFLTGVWAGMENKTLRQFVRSGRTFEDLEIKEKKAA